MTGLPVLSESTALDPEIRGLDRGFIRLLDDAVRSQREAYLLASNRSIATLPEPHLVRDPALRLSGTPTPDEIKAYTYSSPIGFGSSAASS
jgi:hypothetical protein